MRWMNQSDADYALRYFVEKRAETPNLYQAALTLHRLVEWVNNNSDGWGYWMKPSRAADRLMELLEPREQDPDLDITDAELKWALIPIKAFFTRNKFDPSEVLSTPLVTRTPDLASKLLP